MTSTKDIILMKKIRRRAIHPSEANIPENSFISLSSTTEEQSMDSPTRDRSAPGKSLDTSVSEGTYTPSSRTRTSPTIRNTSRQRRSPDTSVSEAAYTPSSRTRTSTTTGTESPDAPGRGARGASTITPRKTPVSSPGTRASGSRTTVLETSQISGLVASPNRSLLNNLSPVQYQRKVRVLKGMKAKDLRKVMLDPVSRSLLYEFQAQDLPKSVLHFFLRAKKCRNVEFTKEERDRVALRNMFTIIVKSPGSDKTFYVQCKNCETIILDTTYKRRHLISCLRRRRKTRIFDQFFL